MADIELVIKIPEELYQAYKGRPPMLGDAGMDMIAQSIANGTQLPKGHGDLIDKDHIITRIENERDYFNGMITDIFDRRYAQGLNEAAIKVSEEKPIIPAEQEVD